jgi:uncharacterized protein
MTRFFDTYAILGILKAEPAYASYREAGGYTHSMNLLESIVHLARSGDPAPLRTVKTLRLSTVSAQDEDLLVAAALKLGPKRGLSYVDALGYAIARRLNVAFLTGDSFFRDVPGVEFVR